MGSFTAQIKIDAPKERVWEVLADLGNIYKWNPGVVHSYSTSEEPGGEEATRHCDVQQGPLKGYLEERAFDWREGEGYKIEIIDTNFPNKGAVVEFSVKEAKGGTVVEASPVYQLKFGILGYVIDRVFFERQFRKAMAGLLAGLKHHVETGEEVSNKVPKIATARV